MTGVCNSVSAARVCQDPERLDFMGYDAQRSVRQAVASMSGPRTFARLAHDPAWQVAMPATDEATTRQLTLLSAPGLPESGCRDLRRQINYGRDRPFAAGGGR